METIAVYWESKIRIYGITTRSGLAFFRLAYPLASAPFWSRRLECLQSVADRFYLLTVQVVDADVVQLNLVVDLDAAGQMHLLLNARDEQRRSSLFRDEDVDLVYLHGPHFQDRYGIAEAALSLLANNKLPILASTCTGTSMNFVVASPMAAAVVNCLSVKFVVPGSDGS